MCLSCQVADSVAHLQLEHLRYVCLQTDTHCYRAHTLEQTHCTHTSSSVRIVRIPGMFAAHTHTHSPISRLPLISLCKTLAHKY